MKETTLEAYQHQDLPFEQLVDHLEIERSLNHNPVFQVIFDFHNFSFINFPDFKDIKPENIASGNCNTKLDLSIFSFEHEEGIEIRFEYLKDIFEENTIKRFGEHFEILIQEVIHNPHQFIDEISFLTLKEKETLLIEWNDTKTSYPKDKTIHQLFEEQVEKTPNNIAVIFEDQELTYQELNEKANQLGSYLREKGVKPDTLVAIACERSLEMIIGILGILKAGGAYVPLDLDNPKERLQFILEDVNPPIIITNAETIDKLPSTWAQIICLDEEWSYINTFSSFNFVSLLTPCHLAYVIYTSGSTGKPKGVGVKRDKRF